MTRDFSGSIFRLEDIHDYLNESIDRIRQIIKQCKGMTHLNTDSDAPILLPDEYHVLLSTYATSRCFGQDERHYQATTYMNEFETKLDELKIAIENGDVIITNPDGTVVDDAFVEDYVIDNYFEKRYTESDLEKVASSEGKEISTWDELDEDWASTTE